MKIEVKLMSSENIKPSSPTPKDLQRHNLSILDQISPPVLMPLVIFYPHNENTQVIDKAKHLKDALSKTLTHFYPLAGKMKQRQYIDCNDVGVPCFDTVVDCGLDEFIADKNGFNPEELRKFVAYDLNNIASTTMSLQFNFFQCGGLAIGLEISHNVADALSMIMFLNTWSAIARGETSIEKPDFFSGHKIFPQTDLSDLGPPVETQVSNLVMKHFVFSSKKIASLREKYSANNRTPTRVEAISAFIGSRVIAVKSEADNDEADKKTRIYRNVHVINLRSRTNPPLPQNVFGNLISFIKALPDNESYSDEIKATSIRQELSKVDEIYDRGLGDSDKYLNVFKDLVITPPDVFKLVFTSLCRFPLYEADFGWGKPIWLTPVLWPMSNFVNFFDTYSEEGIEAWITLDEEDMAKLATDEEFLSYVH